MRPRLVTDEFDDQGDYVPKPVFGDREVESPFDMAHRQIQEARAYVKRVEEGGHLRFPWLDLDRVVGSLLPGWFVAVGGRAKAGKTTFLRELLTAWVELKKTVVYVGTETEPCSLRLAWGAVRSGLPACEGLTPSTPGNKAKVQADLSSQLGISSLAIFGDIGKGTVADLAYWVEYARVAKADVLIFDHIHRLDVGPGEHWQGLGQAVRLIKNMARDAQMLVVAGAQLKQGMAGDVLAEHEVPGNGSWAETATIQREADVAVQLWRPLKPGVTNEQKRLAKDDGAKLPDVVQQNVMGVRVAAHRWRGEMANQFVRLYVEQDQITSWSSR